MSSSPRLYPEAERTEKYRLLAELGEGGMATVYLAIARGPAGFNKLLVLKVIRKELAEDPRFVEMFLAEASLAARLSHPNVVQTLEVSELDGRPAIVMEYLDGQPLSSIMVKDRDIPQAVLLRALATSLEGLSYCHDLADFDGTPLKLVHRDISPHNIFVTFDGQVKLLDFGIAKARVSSGRSNTNELKGKVRYMAPEQICGEALDRRADLFAVGVILWEITTGQRIWLEKSDVNVMHAVLNEGVPAPKTVNPAVNAALNDICVKALSQSPEGRYQTAGELQAAIEAVLAEMGPAVLPKQIGAILSTTFAAKREKTKEIIEAELKKAYDPKGEPSARFAFRPDLISLSSGSRSGVDHSVVAAVVPNHNRRRIVPIALLVLGAAAAGVVASASFLRRSESVTPGPPNGSAVSTPPPLPSNVTPLVPSQEPTAKGAANEPKVVQVQISSKPANATLFLDGQPLGKNPYVGARPQDSATHVLRAEAPGYLSRSMDVALDHDLRIVVPPLSKRAGANVPPATTTTPVASAPAAPSPNNACAPPFYFDAQGIKHLKPECVN